MTLFAQVLRSRLEIQAVKADGLVRWIAASTRSTQQASSIGAGAQPLEFPA